MTDTITPERPKVDPDRRKAELDLKKVKKLYLKAREAQRLAQEALAETAPIAKNRAGMQILEIAEQAGVTRQTVYAALGQKVRRFPA